ncbi:MAG TPA: HAD family hydrolase [Anaerolineae bacterium]|nr:HAD family hydrolase [Anaerolineae bacterium]
MLTLDIPAYGKLNLEYLLLDMNGTIAVDGQVIDGVAKRLKALKTLLKPLILTADTHGTATSVAWVLEVEMRRLQAGGNEATQKETVVAELGPERVVAIGNGANDAAMLRRAALGIAILGGEGSALSCLTAADVLAADINTALDLLLNPRRLLATLRA